MDSSVNTGNFRNPDGTFAEGNPGKPKGAQNFTTKVREALEKIADGKSTTYEQEFIKTILNKGIKQGDSQIIKLMWNYLDGLPTAHIDHTTGGEKIQMSTITDSLSSKYEQELRDALKNKTDA